MRFPRKGEPGWTGPPELVPLIERIFAVYPEARDFDPCDCGLTLAVVEPEYVDPDLHFVIDNLRFRNEALRLIREHRLPNAAYEGLFGVLILAERA
jgi:hypothetical protein